MKALSGSGIKSQTVAGLLVELEGYTRDDGTKVDPTRKLTNKSVLVIDEAAMVDSRSLARLQALAHEAKAKMILVGDEAQVPPVAAGNPFKSLKKNLDFVEQTENRRQKIEWQKEASRELREGHVGEALERYAVAGMLATAKDRESALTGLVGKWAEEYNPEKPGALLLAASRNVDVDEINRRAKAAMLEKGHLGGIRAEVKTAHGIAEFQAGDRIFFSAISKKYHHFRAGQVANGEFGTLQKIGQDASGTWLFHVKLDQKDGQGPTVVFDPLKYDHFKYGYATTIYKSQGDTLEKTFNYVASAQSLNELYVQLTRHELGAEIAMPEDQVDKMADRAGVELAPTEKMLSLAESLAENEKNGLELPEGIAQDFDLCRSFLNRHASSQMNERTQEQQEELDFGLEKVRSLIGSIRSREKMNALDFIVEPEEKSVTSHEKDQVEKETPEAARESGKEKGRERIRERDGLYLGL
ncbi:MAG: Conjugal protein, TraA [Leptospirillum sp. Group IV 'UBA BS']|nr:MAG: Conjugal protein, TraA [Leptospirillum sp. Group IV 'UBA BS']